MPDDPVIAIIKIRSLSRFFDFSRFLEALPDGEGIDIEIQESAPIQVIVDGDEFIGFREIILNGKVLHFPATKKPQEDGSK